MRPQVPLVLSSLLVRLGIGIVVTQIAVSLFSTVRVADWVVGGVAICAVTGGTLISMLHLGRPNRLLHAFYNISSPLTWEAILTPLLLGSMSIVVVVSFVGGAELLVKCGKIGAAVFGVSLIYTMGKVYHLKARPSWSSSMVVYEFFVSAACMGILGLAAMESFNGEEAELLVRVLAGCAVVVLLLETVITMGYRRFVFRVSVTAADVLRENASKKQYFVWLGAGLLIPLLLSVIFLLTGEVKPALSLAAFISFCMGALFWRILFFKCATPMKITPDIDTGDNVKDARMSHQPS